MCTDGRTDSRTATGPGSWARLSDRPAISGGSPDAERGKAVPTSVGQHPGAVLLTPRQGQAYLWRGSPAHPDPPELAPHSHRPAWPRPRAPKQNSQFRIHKEANGRTPALVAEGAGRENRDGHFFGPLAASALVSTQSTVQGAAGEEAEVPTNTYIAPCFPRRGLRAATWRLCLRQDEGASWQTTRSPGAPRGSFWRDSAPPCFLTPVGFARSQRKSRKEVRDTTPSWTQVESPASWHLRVDSLGPRPLWANPVPGTPPRPWF